MNAVDWHGPRRQPCPACGRSDRDKTLGVTLKDDGSGVAHCFRCEYVETWRPDRPGFVARPPARPLAARRAPQQHTVLSDYWRELWGASRPLAGPALDYLQARGCRIPPEDGDLRWHPALRHPSGYVGPALVALVTHAQTRDPLTLHRTWVRPDGTKPPEADPPRLLLAGHRKAGGVIRLWPDEAVTTGLGTAEGIETALSLAHAYTPVWACIDAGNLAALPVLAGVESLVIAADHDAAGVAAAKACADRWAAAGAEVAVVMSATPKADINDLRAAA